MHYERIIGGPVLGFENPPDGAFIHRIGPKPVDCLGRKSDKAAVANYRSRPLDYILLRAVGFELKRESLDCLLPSN